MENHGAPENWQHHTVQSRVYRRYNEIGKVSSRVTTRTAQTIFDSAYSGNVINKKTAASIEPKE